MSSTAKQPLSVCVFCGSREGDAPAYRAAAVALGEALAAGGARLVYGGGKLGLMGASAGAARDAGGQVLGIMPEFLISMEGKLEGVEHSTVSTMHERKMQMFEKSDAFVVLPGGIGTLEEIIELLSWARLDLHKKPLVLLSIDEFWAPLVTLLEHVIARKFADPEMMRDICVVRSVEEVLPTIQDRNIRARA